MAKVDKDSLANTFIIAVFLCLVCSIVVSSLSVSLKPMQLLNKELDQKKNILRAAGMLPADQDVSADGRSIEELFAEFTVRAVDLRTGEYGLWGTLYGYLALDGDLITIAGLGFYQHKETPGLGGEVDNSKWKASWQGVRLFNDMGQPQVRLVKQRSASSNAVADYEVDALSGATFTTKGVENMVNYWTGDGGFGAYLKRLRSNALAQG